MAPNKQQNTVDGKQVQKLSNSMYNLDGKFYGFIYQKS